MPSSESLEISKFRTDDKAVASISRVLVANNGLAAVKCLVSIRQWLLQRFGTTDAMKFVCMATPNEIEAASAYLKLADEIVIAPAGKNANNFANIDLILQYAVEKNVDAVYVGWGHASENPELSRRLEDKGIIFIGPSEHSMIACGDKIVSTVIAQSLNLPTVKWSGSGITVDECVTTLNFSSLRQKATISTADQGLDAIRRFSIDFPLMIKASEGGGGKGIRRCNKIEEFRSLFKKVSIEVPSSPIFIMKCIEGARHVEVQIIGDKFGNVMALSTRDCSIQRRCQKVIEEAPASIVPKDILTKLEKDAVEFAKFVKYHSAGTIEFLYSPKTNELFFLELNPRLQVEHPCSEMICDLNIPAIQIQIASGLRLEEIDEIARYIKNRDKISLHSIAARITCENPDDRFLPSTGHVNSLSFLSSQHSWAYFSVGEGSTVHEYADSQIGHVFARGKDRKEAVANLKNALINLKIDATFSTQIEYIIDLLSLKSFENNTYDTQWLDCRIANKDQPKLSFNIDDVIAVSAAAIGSSKIRKSFQKYEKLLRSGKIVLPVELTRCIDVDLLVKNVKYELTVSEDDVDKYSIHIKTSLGTQHTQVEFIKMGDFKTMNIAIHNGKSIGYTHEETDDEDILKLGGTCFKFEKNHHHNSNVLLSPYTGKFLEYKVDSGTLLKVGETYAQVESMKMIFDVVVKNAPGRLMKVAKEGDLIHPGTILAKLEIDDVIDEKHTSDKFDEIFDSWTSNEKSSIQKCHQILDGKGCSDFGADSSKLESFVKDLQDDCRVNGQWEKTVIELIEKFVLTEKFFDTDVDSFDDSVRKLMSENSNLTDVVDSIYANSQLTVREELILQVLAVWRKDIMTYRPDLLISLLNKLIDMKYLTKVSPFAVEILFEMYEKQRFKQQLYELQSATRMVLQSNGMTIYQIDSENLKPSISRCVVQSRLVLESFNEKSLLEKLDLFTNRAIVALRCIANSSNEETFVANQIQIKAEFANGISISSEDIEIITDCLVEKCESRLKDANVVEINIFTKSMNGFFGISYTDEIGVFIKDSAPIEEVNVYRKPTKRDYKRTIARKNRTTYVYDFPTIFAKCVADIWKSGSTFESPKNRKTLENRKWKEFVEVAEIVVENGNLQFLKDPVVLEKRSEGGMNSCGMVAWLIRLLLPDQLPLEFLLIGNDITYQVGSFAIPEHELFELASKFARQKKIPRINISCNSGARIGVAKEVLNVLKVKMNGADFDYLYLDKEEKENVRDQVVFEEVGNELRLISVKGKANDFIGVENLMGSGSIGGETSRAYREIPTYCYVTGRSVGIGAYTARLARRIIQHEKSHLILTGSEALNTILGKKVYASNNRLGGTEIMKNNGIAHCTVATDLEGVEKLIKWLKYLPIKTEKFPFYHFSSEKTCDLDVEIEKDEMQQDVRNVIMGTETKQGIFDADSFDEVRDHWAASIVTGRAKIGNIPVGVIASQWKSFEDKQLADEALETSELTSTTRPGQVWYPESAFKTSQAISDFNREGLPLVMIVSLRGFSGGRKDMSDMVLTFGAHIIDELSQYNQPVIVYIPSGGELRGGAWAVIDSNVNRGFIHVVADRNSRGGILEPSAIVGIKIREPQIEKLMERNGVEKNIQTDCVKKSFKKAAIEFADMHDTWQRMVSVGAIEHVVSLKDTRRLFWRILRNKMTTLELANRYAKAPCFPKPSSSESLNWIVENLEKCSEQVSDEIDDEYGLDKKFRIIEYYYKKEFLNDLKYEVEASKKRLASASEEWECEM